MTSPVVSVQVAAYNHEKYVAQCLEGILMQKTSFPFEIVVGEDCSLDRTREIVLSYQEKYADQVKVILADHNLGAARNNLQIQRACQGKYQAVCEGDDYWIDPLKLQKQVDFMEAHPDFSMCFHNAFILNEAMASTRLFFESSIKDTLEFDDVCQLRTPTASVMARSSILATLPEWQLKVWSGDLVFRLWCAHHGKLGYLHDIMAVYRVHSGGMVASLKTWRAKARTEELFLYQQLDKDTQYQHTAAIQAQIKRVEEKYRRGSRRSLYYLTSPGRVVTRVREYYRLYKRFKTIKDYGNA